MPGATAKNRNKNSNLALVAAPPEIQSKLFPYKDGAAPILRKAPPDEVPEVRFALQDHTKARSKGWALEASVNSRYNIGEFYRLVYKGLFYNGHNADEEIHTFHLEEGERRPFRPDLTIRGLFGTDFTEIKSRHTGNSQQHCRKAQLENYSFALLQRIDEGDLLPSVNYAFFMYGNRDPMKLYYTSPEEAMKKLAECTVELLIMPLNLAFLTFYMSKNGVFGKYRTENYWTVTGHLLRKLHEGVLEIPDLIEYHGKQYNINVRDVKRFARRSSLCLNQLVTRKKSSEEISPLRYGDTEIRPFPITVYSLTNPEKWNRSFFKYHSAILGQLGVRDTYAEWRKTILPF